MKIFILLAISFIYTSAMAISWNAIVKNSDGSEKNYNLNNKRTKIKIPKSEWHCWVSDVKQKKLEGFDSEGRRLDCLMGQSMASVPLFCLKGDIKPKRASMLLNDSREIKNRIVLNCE